MSVVDWMSKIKPDTQAIANPLAGRTRLQSYVRQSGSSEAYPFSRSRVAAQQLSLPSIAGTPTSSERSASAPRVVIWRYFAKGAWDCGSANVCSKPQDQSLDTSAV
jgi:hypothetical protein